MNAEWAREIENTMKEGRFQFAIKCLNKIMQINPDTNFVFSPPCIYEGLLLMYVLIKGNIAMRLNKILFLKEISLLDLTNYCTYYKKKEQWEKIRKHKDLSYSSCDHYVRCWSEHDINFGDNAALHMLRSRISSLDLTHDFYNMYKVDAVLRQIVNQIKGYIYYPEGLAEMTFTGNDFILISFMCGIFRNPSAHQTDATNVSTIRNDQIISYYHEGLSMYVMDIPYNNANISLFTLLPAALSSGEWKIIENISSNDLFYLTLRMSTDEGMNNLRELLRNSRTSKLKEFTYSQNFSFSFEMEKNMPVRDLLKSLGAGELVTSEMIELRTKCQACILRRTNCPKVHINNVAHRSHIRATRYDVILGAVTLIHSGGDASLDGKIEDVDGCNKPFIWLIYDRLQEEILCVGSCHNSTCPDSQIVPMDIYQPGASGVPPTKKQRLA